MKKFVFGFCWVSLLATVACALPDMGQGKQAYKDQNYSEAFSHYNRLADFGLPEAKVELGKLYLYGRGAEQDTQRAIDLFQEADKQGSKVAARLALKAQVKLAKANLKSGDKAERVRGVQLLEKVAAHNEPEALFELAQIYEAGQVVPTNAILADQYYSKAAAQNYPKAAYYHARMYRNGQIVPKDLGKALNLYKQAGDSGYPKAYIAIAEIYEKELAGPDYSKAYFYYKLAEEKGEIAKKDLKVLLEKADDYTLATM